MPSSDEIRPYWLWLVPAPRDRDRLRVVVEGLGHEFGTPSFEPHVTLGGVRAALTALEAALDEVAGRWPPLRLVAGATGHGPQRFTTLFVQFDDARIHALAGELLGRVGEPFDPDLLRPHLSLLYRPDLAVERRAALARRHDLTGHRIVFDAVVAMHTPGGPDDVDSWETLIRRPLRAAASDERR